MIDKLYDKQILTPEEEGLVEELEELILNLLSEINGEEIMF